MKEGFVLLVEDNPDDEMLARRALKKCDLVKDIHICRDGAEAVEFLFGDGEGHCDHPIPALILLDLQLPKLTGLEVLERIRASNRTRLIPVVILTTSNEERDLVEGYRLGVNSFIVKPVDYQKFVDAVQQIGTYWMALNATP